VTDAATSSVAAARRTLSEADSRALLRSYGVPVVDDREVTTADAAVTAASALGLPVAVKLCGESIAHKTERGLVRLGLATAADVRSAAGELLAAATADDGPVSLLVAPMVSGRRELIAGVVHDPQFGPNVMVGVGGVLAEAIADVVFRPVPISDVDAAEMIDGLRTQRLLGPFRGEASVDRDGLVAAMTGLSRLGQERPDIASVDVNPLIIRPDGTPLAVDALVELAAPVAAGPGGAGTSGARSRPSDEAFRALFEPRGVIVAGASSHPGKFGFVSLHNLLASGYEGTVAATNLQGEEVLGIRAVPSVDDLAEGAADLVFVCTPAAANADLLRACSKRGVRAAFIATAGYSEAGEEGRRAERELVALADELGILLAGPNGQGVVSTPVKLCAQIVAPCPPRGHIAVASQSGNFVSSFLNLARLSGVGISRAVSAGNAAGVSVADYLDWFAEDDETTVILAYLESVGDGRALLDRLQAVATRKPLVVVKGGATAGGARAAASHTGALAADDAIFDGACRQAGVLRAMTIEEAFEAAATFATQPLPAGPNVVVVTTAGGWGVVTADAITRDPALTLLTLPDQLRAAIDAKLPPRWSRGNPVDMAGGETRETIPDVLALVAEHPDVHCVVYLGLGIQSNQARMMREGRFYPGHGLERIVAYHERQDARFAEAADEISQRTGKPILTATELAVADPANPGPSAVRASGRLCYASADRAVAALGHLVRYARFRAARGLP
jgi:acetyl-CoA synthetase (ADP-forming)